MPEDFEQILITEDDDNEETKPRDIVGTLHGKTEHNKN